MPKIYPALGLISFEIVPMKSSAGGAFDFQASKLSWDLTDLTNCGLTGLLRYVICFIVLVFACLYHNKLILFLSNNFMNEKDVFTYLIADQRDFFTMLLEN